MLLLGQDHRDGQTFVPKELSAPSLSPPSSGTDAVDLHDQQLKLFPPGNTRKSGHSCGNWLVVVVVVEWLIILKEELLSERLTLAIFFFVDVRR